MRRILDNQSELSIASAVFYAGGGLISLLAVTVFRAEGNPLNTANFVTMLLAFLVTGLFILAGRRTNRTAAIVLMCVSATLVLALAIFSISEIRVINMGLFQYTFMIYLVWFGPMWFARLFSYSWLVLYCAIVAVRFGPETYALLVTLGLTSAMLGELVGRFRNRLEAASLTDPLCRIWNKRGFELILGRAIRVAQRADAPLSVLYLDLDGFKQINDAHGHAEGDRVLRAFAAQVECGTRPEDTLARIGGDEFVLMLPATDVEQAVATATRLREAVEICNWSFGAAQFRPGESIDEFIERADRVMLEEKAERRARAGRAAIDSRA